MKNNSFSQSGIQPSNRSGLLKWTAILGCTGILVLLLVILVLGGLVYMRGSAASRSEIFFRAPQNGERVEAGQPVEVRVFARDEQKIVRIEFWVDGRLIETQTSSIPEGSNPFPLLTNWIPEAGTHTLIARSVNSQDESTQVDITVEAQALADRDADSVADNLDACPDQAGNPAADGCPDRDYDGISDATDACPEVAGLPEDGCPLPTADDTDGDGVLNSADACPDEPGSPLAEGCVDRDTDSIGDSRDACPDEAGSGADGCPTNDADGDTVLDADDACPHEWGLPAHAGCPDADGDGVIDRDDDCPAEPGGADGCPEGGPGGGDPPGGDDDSDDEGVSGGGGIFGDMGGDEAVDLVRLEALSFTTTQSYDEIYCYAGLVGEGMDRYGPFDAVGHHDWDIVEYMGGENTRTFGVTTGSPLNLHVECVGNRGDTVSFNMGSFTQSYDSTQWDGHVIEQVSGAREEDRGDAGHTFNFSFRLCFRTCDAAGFPPPAMRHYTEHIGPITTEYLGWTWDGNRDEITGFRLYVNGHHRETIRDAHAIRINLEEYMPPCDERYEYTLTAYRSGGGDFRQSPPSNPVYIDGEACALRVRVTFTELAVSDINTAGSDMDGLGPIYGAFWASGNSIERLPFDGGECFFMRCQGLKLINGRFSIPGIFTLINDFAASCIGDGCTEASAPHSNYVILALDDDDDITIGGGIYDEDFFDADVQLFGERRSIDGDTVLPIEMTMEDSNIYGNFSLNVRIEVEEGH